MMDGWMASDKLFDKFYIYVLSCELSHNQNLMKYLDNIADAVVSAELLLFLKFSGMCRALHLAHEVWEQTEALRSGL